MAKGGCLALAYLACRALPSVSLSPFFFRNPLWLKASRLKLAAKAVELGGSRLLLKEKKFSRVVTRS